MRKTGENIKEVDKGKQLAITWDFRGGSSGASKQNEVRGLDQA